MNIATANRNHYETQTTLSTSDRAKLRATVIAHKPAMLINGYKVLTALVVIASIMGVL